MIIETRACTFKANGKASVLESPITVSTPSLLQNKTDYKEIEINAIWDTGATNSCISEKVVNALDSKPIRKVPVNGVHGQNVVNGYKVNFRLPNKLIVQDLDVTEAILGEYDALIGMDIIGIGDFAVSHSNGLTCFSFRFPSGNTHIDFVAEVEITNRPVHSSGGGSKRKNSRGRR